ncbi:MAG: sulfite exporter TauE/SafE family protein [Promethearchaeota archaeon]
MVITAGSFIVLFSIALAVSFLAAMVGIGGGVLFIPILVAFFGLSVPEARTISLFCMIFVTISATAGYFKHKCIDWKLGFVYDIFAVPGVFFGTWIASLLDTVFPVFLNIIVVGVLWTLASVILYRKPRNPESLNGCTVEFSFLDPQHSHKMSQSKKWIYPLLSSFFGGFIAGAVGMGGGTIYTSTMLLLEITPIIAVATAEFAMIFTNTFGFLTSAVFPSLGWNFLSNGSITTPILWEFIIPMGIASLIGAFLGTILSRRVKGSFLKKMLAIIAILMGIPLVLDIFGLWGF